MVSIAIDGPAGAGKSTVARAVARELGYIYVDTGALYRTVGLYASANGVDTTDAFHVVRLLKDVHIDLRFVNGEQRVFLNGYDASEEIRRPEISMAASRVSAFPEVREFLFSLQKNMARDHDVVMDGRDIGTVVLPEAQVKIFLTAAPEERARRRLKELTEKGHQITFEALLKEVKERDYNDTHRDIAPLKQADDAVLVDTSELGFEETVAALLKIIKEKL